MAAILLGPHGWGHLGPPECSRCARGSLHLELDTQEKHIALISITRVEVDDIL